MQLTQADKEQLLSKGITEAHVKDQIKTFIQGIPFVDLKMAATINNGVLKHSSAREAELLQIFENEKVGIKLLKFVPASGAASRMFQFLFAFLESYDPKKEDLELYLKRTNNAPARSFFDNLKKFPFYKDIHSKISNQTTDKNSYAKLFVTQMLSKEKENLSFYPKGLLPFHTEINAQVTPFEEHFIEAAAYTQPDQSANLHFTVSEQHKEMFLAEHKNISERIKKKTGRTFKVDFSFQQSSTDTIAVSPDNIPFRTRSGRLLFRPGGHGALIQNLNAIDADVIFIKNIDNVVVAEHLNLIVQQKKVLAGLLLELQKQVFAFAKMLDKKTISEIDLKDIASFIESTLNERLNKGYSKGTKEEWVKILKEKLHRPIRVCGMVKNEGEPGGGPFWIKNKDGSISLQIVESAEVNMEDEHQVAVFKNSTYFNPVDLVCGVKDYQGRKFDLLKFVNYEQGFITTKTQEGKPLKALELPGLWNGAMADWITIFVAVPALTFNPVKTINDLLKPMHQSS